MFLAILLSAVFADEPSSLPIYVPAPILNDSGDALADSLANVLLSVQKTPCSDNTACWRRTSLRLFDALSSGVDGLRLRFKLQASSDQTLALVKISMNLQDTALKTVQPLLQPGGLTPAAPWWEHPTLWVAVGLFIGAGLAVGVAAAIHWVVK